MFNLTKCDILIATILMHVTYTNTYYLNKNQNRSEKY